MSANVNVATLTAKLNAELDQAVSALIQCNRDVVGIRNDWLQDHGICTSCEGRGYHDQHWHDGDSQRNACTACGGNGYFGVEMPKIPEFTSAEQRAAQVLTSTLRDQLRRLSECRKGMFAVVRRGRKVSPGTSGVVFWYGSVRNRFRRNGVMRVGLKPADNPNAEPTWVDAAHCDFYLTPEVAGAMAQELAEAREFTPA